MKLILLVAVAIAAVTPAKAETFNQQVTRLCNSKDQDDCWIKGGTKFCARPGKECRYLMQNTPARVMSPMQKNVQVDTIEGTGFVPASGFVISGEK